MVGYTFPQVKVFQQFSTLPQSVVQNLYAFVFGDNYKLFRYAVADEKALIKLEFDTLGAPIAYDGSASVGAAWPNQPAGSEVDLAYARLFADDVRLTYKTGLSCDVDAEADNVLISALTLVSTSGNAVDDTLPAVGVRIGDYVAFTYDTTKYLRKIVGLEATSVPASLSAVAVPVGQDLAANEITVSGTYTGTRPSILRLQVLTAGTIEGVSGWPRVRLTSTATGASATAYIKKDGETSVLAVGPVEGVTFTIALGATALVEGETATVVATPVSAGPVQRIVLDENIPAAAIATLASVDLQAVFHDQEIACVDAAGTNWTMTADGVEVMAGLTISMPSLISNTDTVPACAVAAADLYLQYRARVFTYTSSISAIQSTDSIESMLGQIDADNPLAFGVDLARKNSGSRPVYFIATAGSDIGDWATVLARAESLDYLYGFAPLTTDPAVIELVNAHVKAMSTPENKRWRVAFVGLDLPTLAPVYNLTLNPNGVNYLAKITNGVLTFVSDGTGTTIDGTVRALTELAAGDQVRIDFASDPDTGVESWDTLTIERVLTNSSVKLLNGTTVADLPAMRVEVLHNRSSEEETTAVAAASTAFHSRRVYHVFAGAATSSNNQAAGGEFVAAAIAGLCSSVAPQQGLTNIEVSGFSSLPSMYRKFTPTQLNRMAAAGTLLVAQDYMGGPIYVRHQISTAFVDGNLNTSELSLVKNLDSISYLFAARFRKFIGVKNITPTTLAEIELLAKDALDYLMSRTEVEGIGPQLLGNTTKINSVYQDPVLQDSVNMDIDLELPKPFNTLNLTLRAV